MPEMKAHLIAPCGMNCRLCMGYIRTKNRCLGCRSAMHKRECRMKHCRKRTGRFCHACASFPCALVTHIDKRYRTKYGMSMIENLTRIKRNGVRAFIAREEKRWKCAKCGSIICVHRPHCTVCGKPRRAEADR